MKKTWLVQLMLLVVLAGCVSKPEMQPTETFLPFQNEEGLYGLIDERGKVVVEARFTSEPCMARYGRFWLYNAQEEMFELYSVDAEPRLLGRHRQAAVFNAPIAPVCDDNGHIQLIDSNNNVVKTLDQVDGKAVDVIITYPCGLFRFTTDDQLFGVMDAEGNVIVKPDYAWLTIDDSRHILAVDKKYGPSMDEEMYNEVPYFENRIEIQMMDDEGEVLGTIDTGQYKAYELNLFDGMLKMATAMDGDEPTQWVLIQADGTLAFESERGEYIVEVDDSMVVVVNDEGDCAIRSLDGETIIGHGEYFSLSPTGHNGWIIAVGDESQNYQRTLVNRDGRKKYEGLITEFFPYIGQTAVIRLDGDEHLHMVDADGDLIETPTNLMDLGGYATLYEMVESAYLDVEAFADQLAIRADGFLGFNRSQQTTAICDTLSAYGQQSGNRWPYLEPFYFSSEDHNIPASLTVGGVSMEVGFKFDNPIVTYDKDEFASWNDLNPILLGLGLGIDERRVRGKEMKLLQALKERVKKVGNLEEETDYALLMRTDDGHGILTAFDGQTVILLCGEWSEVNYSLDIFRPENGIGDQEGYNFFSFYIASVG